MRRLRRAFTLSLLAAAGLFGCELIVSSTAPDFRCTPNNPTSCPAGMTCNTSFVCVVGSGGEGEGGPIDTLPRDSGKDSSSPKDSGLAQIGDNCDSEHACDDLLFCATPNVLTASIVGTTDSICAKTCCQSSDCPDGFVCFSAGTGGNYCLSAERAKRSDLGRKKPGSTCGDNDECRSGVCTDGRCLDTCCAAENCASGTICRVKIISTPPPARETWVCAAAEKDASLATGSGCAGGAACFNDNCAGYPPRCRPPCCNNADCPTLGTFAFCAYGDFTTTASKTKWCFEKTSDAGAPIGAPCQGNPDCATRFCDPDSKHCGSVCCQDSDCGEDEACLPTVSALLRCVPKTIK